MCGRYTYKLTWEEIVALYRLTLDQTPRNIQPRYNVCPTTDVDVVVSADGKRSVAPMRWGLIAAWWNKPLKELKLATFNARAESIATKPMFRDSFARRRCLMPASGYYEWQHLPNEKKPQPWYFTRADGQPLTFAAIHDTWTNRETNEKLRSVSMVITQPNEFVAEVHDRMPVVLEAKDFEQWEHGDPDDATALMKPAGEDVLQRWPVSKRVNSSKADDGDTTLIAKIHFEERAS